MNACQTYETLRGQVLQGQARPDGLGAIVFHGMWRGLVVLLSAPSAPRPPLDPATGAPRCASPGGARSRSSCACWPTCCCARSRRMSMPTDYALKISADHLRRDAFLYVRQSSLRQVFENTESTKRQYALRDRAVALGWPIERVHVIDSDLGLLGRPGPRSRRLPAPGHRGGDGPRRHRAGAGGLAPGTQQRRLAPPARAGRACRARSSSTRTASTTRRTSTTGCCSA